MVSPAGALLTQSAHPISLTRSPSPFHSPHIITFFFTPSSPSILVLACPILSHCTSLHALPRTPRYCISFSHCRPFTLRERTSRSFVIVCLLLALARTPPHGPEAYPAYPALDFLDEGSAPVRLSLEFPGEGHILSLEHESPLQLGCAVLWGICRVRQASEILQLVSE